jgi:hypothetical protein
MESNSALNKFNKDTPASLARKAERELVENEFNDARTQVMKKLFDFVSTYNDEFDKLRKPIGNKEADLKLNTSLRNFFASIDEAKGRVERGENVELEKIITAYNTLINDLAVFNKIPESNQPNPNQVDTKPYTDGLRSSGEQLQDLMNMLLGKARQEQVRQADFQKPSPVELKSRSRLPETADEKPVDGRTLLNELSQQDSALQADIIAPVYESKPVFEPPNQRKPRDEAPISVPVAEFGKGKAHGKKRGRGKDDPPNLENMYNVILNLELLINQVSSGFIDYKPFRKIEERPSHERELLKNRLLDPDGNITSLEQEKLGYLDRIAQIENDIGSFEGNKAVLSKALKDLDKLENETKQAIMAYNEAKLGSFRPHEPDELNKIFLRIYELKQIILEKKKQPRNPAVTFRRGKTELLEQFKTRWNTERSKSATKKARKEITREMNKLKDEGKLNDDDIRYVKGEITKEQRFPTEGYLGLGKAHGKAHGGQAGFSIEKTREIAEQWPNYPYYVPPASKTGPKLNNPRSRVHIPTEGNGKPKRGRPKKCSPKSPKKGGILPLLGLAFKFAAKQAVKHVAKKVIKKAVKNVVKKTAKKVVKREVKNEVKDQVKKEPEQGEAPEAPAPAPAPQSPADVFYCRTRARQGISDPKCGTGKKETDEKMKKKFREALDKRKEKMNKEAKQGGFNRQRNHESRLKAKKEKEGGGKKKAKKSGKPKYDVI